MPGIVAVAIIVPAACFIGGILGLVALRQDFPAFKRIPFWLFAMLAVMLILPGPRQKPKQLLEVLKAEELPPPAPPELDILVFDTVTGLEELWCSYPIERVTSTVASLNELYNPLKLFWQRGEERPDRALARQQEAERARYITRPLARKGVPVYRNNTYPAQVIAYAPDHAAALRLQDMLMRERGISTTVPGEGA